MSVYYQYEFVSPEPIFALIKEELRSYFESGSIDDTMFNIWMNRALKKLGKSSNKILPTILEQCDFQSKLPPDFKSVREAWLCHGFADHIPYQLPNSTYEQTICRVTPEFDECNPCLDCIPDVFKVTFKSNLTVPVPDFRFRRKFLLKPGNLNSDAVCGLPCRNLGSNVSETFDIRDGKFVTNFREGIINLLYYSEERNEEDYQLIPDNFWVQEYIKRYIEYQLFLQLWNQTTDETFNQIEHKMQTYKQMADESWTMADIEVKKKTAFQIQRDIQRDRHRLDKYRIR